MTGKAHSRGRAVRYHKKQRVERRNAFSQRSIIIVAAYILQILILAGCILLVIKPDISNYKPKAWWNKRRLIMYRIVFAVFAAILAWQLIKSISGNLG